MPSLWVTSELVARAEEAPRVVEIATRAKARAALRPLLFDFLDILETIAERIFGQERAFGKPNFIPVARASKPGGPAIQRVLD